MRIRNLAAAVVSIVGLAMTIPCLAQGAAPAQGAPPAQGATSGTSGHAPTDVQLKGDKFFAEVDSNHDGKLSKEEWAAQGLPEGVFTRMDTDKDGFLTLKEVEANWFPGDLDTDKDGILTVAKMKAYSGKMAARRAAAAAAGSGSPASGAAPAAGAPSGSAPAGGPPTGAPPAK